MTRPRFVQIAAGIHEIYGLTDGGEVWVYVNPIAAAQAETFPGWQRIAGDDRVRSDDEAQRTIESSARAFGVCLPPPRS